MRASPQRSTACGAVRRSQRSSTARSPRPGSVPSRRVADQAMTALRRLLASNGTGVSGFPFFAGPVDRSVRVLGALKSALDLAASPAFAPAFGGSTALADYRWGRLHRITFSHLLGPAFSLPGRRARGPRCRPPGRRDRRRLRRRRRLVAQPARGLAERLPLRERAGTALRRRDAAFPPRGRAGHAGWGERQSLRPVLRQPDRALADGRLPPRDRAGGRDRERRDVA